MSEVIHVEKYPDFEKSALVTRCALNDFKLKNIKNASLETNVFSPNLSQGVYWVKIFNWCLSLN